MVCPNCGREVKTGSQFCPGCGNQIGEVVSSGPSPQVSGALEIKPKKKMKLWIKVLLGLALVIVIVVILALMLTSGMVKTIEAQLQALKAGDIATAYSYTSKDFQATTSLNKFKWFVSEYPALSKNKSHSFNERVSEGNIGTVSGTLTSSDEGGTPVKYQLVKEGGTWKILNITLNAPGLPTRTVQPPAPAPEARPPVASAMKIVKIDAGTTTDGRGIVNKPLTVFRPDSREISISVYIANGVKGVDISTFLELTDSGEKTKPISQHLENNGDTISLFSFTSPPQGWPKGKYRIHVETSRGLKKSVSFHVR